MEAICELDYRYTENNKALRTLKHYVSANVFLTLW